MYARADVDGSGAISFSELNNVLRRQVDFSTGGNERFDAATGTYTTQQTAVKQHVKSTSLPMITTSASVTHMQPQLLSVVPSDAARAEKHHAGRHARDMQAFKQDESMQRKSQATRAVHDVEAVS